ncbi:MAG: hypothetical protein JJU03_01660 [Idiomarina sp.]|nr:hypothetical protein [Idiomarina sp.]
MNKSLLKSGLGISLCLVALAGCASNVPTTADLMRQHAEDGGSQVALQSQLTKDWEKGEKMLEAGEKRVKDGEKRVKSAESDLEKGQGDIARGRSEMSEGRRIMAASEMKFRELFPELDISMNK